MSFRAFIFKKALRVALPRTMDIEKSRKKLEELGSKYKISKETTFEPVIIAGVNAEWAATSENRDKKAIIYLHGGSYCVGAIATYRAFSGGIALASGIPVLTVGYRLAPENPYPAALDDTVAIYRELLSKGYKAKDIVLMGDSAGGGLCLAAAMYLRDNSEPLPAAIALISPWTDLTMSSESCNKLASKDPICYVEFEKKCALAYAGGKDLTDPYISPLYGSFKALPPIIIQCGTVDIGADDFLKTYEKAIADGADVTFRIWKGMFHNFTIFCENTPEGMQSFLEIISWIKQHISQ